MQAGPDNDSFGGEVETPVQDVTGVEHADSVESDMEPHPSTMIASLPLFSRAAASICDEICVFCSDPS